MKLLQSSRSLGWQVALVLALVALVLLGPWIAPYDPVAVDLGNVLAAPSGQHWLGTDQLGRDLFSRVLAGGQRTVGISLAAIVLCILVGATLGLLSGIKGKWLDWGVMRVSDAFLSFPEYVVTIVITGILGAGYVNLLLAIVAVKWVGYAKLVRAIVREQRGATYLTAARISGAGTGRIVVGHLVPHAWGPVLSLATVDLGKIVLLVASLSFLGLGVPQPVPEWGFMLNEGRLYFGQTQLLMLAPGLAIFLFVLATSLVGDRLALRLGRTTSGEEEK
ncbi:ABC transporter permease [Corynebacterium vitaeruminis]|uniref:ABC transporter permease n=1 Tax=Corynebacterium vitaeruminis TaxID=38305 RepID=UPI0023F268BF|nr:ABC transporter permease [Corynebacterium vitaeruminis]